jgi:acyl carrier protein
MTTMTAETLDNQIRSVLRAHGRLGPDPNQLASSTDLYQSGLTSHASVNVMLALESTFDIEFPDHMLRRNVFSSIDAIRQAVTDLTTR